MMQNKKNQISVALSFVLAVSAGTAWADHITLNAGLGWSYRFDPSESRLLDIEGNGTSDICSNCFALRIDGVTFNGSGSSVTLGGEGRFTGTEALSGLTVSRESYVPTTANFFRQITTLTNSTAAPIVVTVNINTSSLSASAANINVAASSSGDTAAGIDDTWLTINGDVGDVVMGHVLGSTGASETVDVFTVVNGNVSFNYEWQNVSVPANSSIMFMHFTVGEVDDATALASTTALAGLTNNLIQLKGIVPADYNKIVNWNFTDTDGDGMPDIYEAANGLNPAVDDSAGDLDGDGLTNVAEYNNGTDINNTDTDADGLSDGDEVNTYNTNPLIVDTDADGFSDSDEVATFGADPLDAADGAIVQVSSGANPTHSPVVAVDSLGRNHIAWMEEVADPVTTNLAYNVMYKLLDSVGKTLIDTTRISDSGSEGDSNQGHPAIAIDADNHAYIAWFSSGTSPRIGYFIGINPANAALDGSASTVATLEKFATVAAGNCKRSDLAVDTNNNIHMVCSDALNSTVMMLVFAADGTVVTAPYDVTGSTTNGCCGPDRISLALDASNRGVIAMYNDGSGEIAYAMVDGVAGTVLTATTDLSTNGGTDNQRQVSISVDAAGMAYLVWGDRANGAQLGSFDPSLDDLNGDVAVPATVGFSFTSLATPGQWYISAALGSDDQMMIAYNKASTGNNDGGKNAIAPRYFTKLDKTGVVTTAETAIAVSDTTGATDTLANFIGIADQDTNLVVYASGASAVIRLARADNTRFVALPAAPTPPASGSSGSSGLFGLSLWSMFGLPVLLGLLRLRRIKQ